MKAATTRLSLLALAMALSACAALEGDKIDYKSAAKGSTLEVPPDLTQLSRDSRYAVPGGPVSAAALQAGHRVFVREIEIHRAFQSGSPLFRVVRLVEPEHPRLIQGRHAVCVDLTGLCHGLQRARCGGEIFARLEHRRQRGQRDQVFRYVLQRLLEQPLRVLPALQARGQILAPPAKTPPKK